MITNNKPLQADLWMALSGKERGSSNLNFSGGKNDGEEYSGDSEDGDANGEVAFFILDDFVELASPPCNGLCCLFFPLRTIWGLWHGGFLYLVALDAPVYVLGCP